MSTTASLTDSETGEVLLFYWDDGADGWMPALDSMEDYRKGNLTVARDSDGTIVTYNAYNPEQQSWPSLTMEDDDQIRGILTRPWIMPGNISAEGPLLCWDASPRLLTIPREDPEPSDTNTNTNQNPNTNPMPRHVADILIRQAVIGTAGATCPITLEPITLTNASVTSCGHIFQTAAIRSWHAENPTCPECRQLFAL